MGSPSPTELSFIAFDALTRLLEDHCRNGSDTVSKLRVKDLPKLSEFCGTVTAPLFRVFSVFLRRERSGQNALGSEDSVVILTLCETEGARSRRLCRVSGSPSLPRPPSVALPLPGSTTVGRQRHPYPHSLWLLSLPCHWCPGRVESRGG